MSAPLPIYVSDVPLSFLASFQLYKEERMKLYVGNLNYQATEDDLTNYFGEFGEVTSARIVQDRETRRSKGFGFVEFGNYDEGKKALEELNGSEFMGRQLRVDEAKEKPRR
jgi:RNA recognition motif-containing protein